MSDQPVSKYQIETNVPIPTPRRGRKGSPVAPWEEYGIADLPIGGSITLSSKKEVQRARNAAQSYSKHMEHAVKFVTRDLSGQRRSSGGVYPPETYGLWRVPLTAQRDNEDVAPTHIDSKPVLVVTPEG